MAAERHRRHGSASAVKPRRRGLDDGGSDSPAPFRSVVLDLGDAALAAQHGAPVASHQPQHKGVASGGVAQYGAHRRQRDGRNVTTRSLDGVHGTSKSKVFAVLPEGP